MMDPYCNHIWGNKPCLNVLKLCVLWCMLSLQVRTTSTLATPTITQAPKKNYVKRKCPSSRAQPVFLDLDGNPVKDCEIVYVSE